MVYALFELNSTTNVLYYVVRQTKLFDFEAIASVDGAYGIDGSCGVGGVDCQIGRAERLYSDGYFTNSETATT